MSVLRFVFQDFSAFFRISSPPYFAWYTFDTSFFSGFSKNPCGLHIPYPCYLLLATSYLLPVLAKHTLHIKNLVWPLLVPCYLSFVRRAAAWSTCGWYVPVGVQVQNKVASHTRFSDFIFYLVPSL